MFFRNIITLCALLAAPAIAMADPAGSFNVKGTSEDGSEYTGTVKVVRNGGTYAVSWKIGKDESVGTGLGAKFSGNGERFEMGPASDEDSAISVGYVSKENFGIAMYFEQPDGSWQGVWTYGGSEKVASETWTRR